MLKTKMMQKKPNVFKSKDLITFLESSMSYHRAKNSKSLRTIADELDEPVSLVSMVLNRKRIPSRRFVDKLLLYFNLNPEECSIVDKLFSVYTDKKIKNKAKNLQEIVKKKKFRLGNPEEYELARYLSKWHYVAIKEMTADPDFKEDITWIQNRLAFKVSRYEIVKALEFLKKTGILIQNESRWVASKKDMNCEDGIYRISLGGFHQQIFDLASQSIEEIEREKRLILGYTHFLNQDQLSQAHAILNDAFSKIKELGADSSGETPGHSDVYHFEFVSIPMTLKNET